MILIFDPERSQLVGDLSLSYRKSVNWMVSTQAIGQKMTKQVEKVSCRNSKMLSGNMMTRSQPSMLGKDSDLEQWLGEREEKDQEKAEKEEDASALAEEKDTILSMSGPLLTSMTVLLNLIPMNKKDTQITFTLKEREKEKGRKEKEKASSILV